MELSPSVLTGKTELSNHYKKSTSYSVSNVTSQKKPGNLRVHQSYRHKSSDMYFFAHLEVFPLCVHQDARLLPLG